MRGRREMGVKYILDSCNDRGVVVRNDFSRLIRERFIAFRKRLESKMNQNEDKSLGESPV